ncbi:hypothetical protein ACWY4P_38685 [Streptomyces sp. LZ34]
MSVCTMGVTLQRTTKALAAGEDIVGGWYLTGSLICSPHHLRPEISCPQR